MDYARSPSGAMPPDPYGNPPAPGAYEHHHGPGPKQGQSAYGLQSRRDWLAGDNSQVQIVDLQRSEYLWRVAIAVAVNLQFRLIYGTGASVELDGLRAPFEAFIPGQVGLYARKVTNDQIASVRATVTAATGGVPVVRMPAPAPGSLLPANAKSYVALSASTLTVNGVAGVAVAAGVTLPLIAPATLTAGQGFLELSL
jgi:hypothetical protein